jgi:hypothetical protein
MKDCLTMKAIKVGRREQMNTGDSNGPNMSTSESPEPIRKLSYVTRGN